MSEMRSEEFVARWKPCTCWSLVVRSSASISSLQREGMHKECPRTEGLFVLFLCFLLVIMLKKTLKVAILTLTIGVVGEETLERIKGRLVSAMSDRLVYKSLC